MIYFTLSDLYTINVITDLWPGTVGVGRSDQ